MLQDAFGREAERLSANFLVEIHGQVLQDHAEHLLFLFLFQEAVQKLDNTGMADCLQQVDLSSFVLVRDLLHRHLRKRPFKAFEEAIPAFWALSVS